MSTDDAVGRKYPEVAESSQNVSLAETMPDLHAILTSQLDERQLGDWSKTFKDFSAATGKALQTGKVFPDVDRSGRNFGADVSDNLEKYFDDGINAIQVAISNSFPFHSVCQLRLFFPEGTYIGTGWLASADTVVTVGHNLYSWDDDDPDGLARWLDSAAVAPGRFESEYYGFGPYEAKRPMQITAEWQTAADKKSRRRTLDLGMIKLPRPVNSALKPFDIAVLGDEELRQKKLTVCGYPNNPDGNPAQTGRRQWSCTGEVMSVEAEHLLYRLDTWGGHSGSPLWAEVDGVPKVIGIHMGGEATESNWAVRITDDVARLIRSWIDLKA